jgi:hypothetical protein
MLVTLIQFLHRLTFGIALAMLCTPSRQVTSGFFRVHLWVLMGLETFAALAIYSLRSESTGETAAAPLVGGEQLGLAISAAVISYVGAVIWMYEAFLLGKLALASVVLLSASALSIPLLSSGSPGGILLTADALSGGALAGLVTAAMLLGHWYLNTPTMQLAPLQRLLILLALSLALRVLVSGIGAGSRLFAPDAQPDAALQVFLGLRWIAGLLAPAGMTWLTWQTLKIPNTQSATGILYAAVIVVFIGELTSQILTAQAGVPL